MCGIAAYISFGESQNLKQYTQGLLEGIAHRGPDGQHSYIDPHDKHLMVHALLKIMDKSENSVQPRKDADGNALVYNGSIYNYQSLKEKYELPEEYNDTQTLFHLLKDRKQEIFAELEGTYAIIYYDEPSDSYIVARDRFGEKPLFYTQIGRDLVFASERKSLWNIGVKKDVNWSVVIDFMCYHRIGNLQNMYHDISQVPAGRYAVIDGTSDTFMFEEIRYSTQSVEDTFEDTFTHAISDTAITNYPLAHTLSGGVDSSGLLAFAKKQYPIESYSFTSPGYENDEREQVECTAEYLGIESPTWVSFPDNPEEIIEDWKTISKIHEEPLASPSSMAQYYLYQAIAKDGYRVLVEGQGSDEIFCGYTTYYTGLLYDGVPSLFYTLFRSTLLEKRVTLKKILYRLSPKLYRKKYIEKGQNIKDIIGIDTDMWNRHAPSLKDNMMSSAKVGVNNQMKYDQKEGLFPYILRTADRSGMYQHVEIRLPYLYSTMVRLARGLSLRDYWHRGYYKYYLRTMLSGKVPDKVLWKREKMGFGAPYSNIVDTPVFRKELQKAIEYLENIGFIESEVFMQYSTDKEEYNMLAWKIVAVYYAVK